MEEEFGGEWIHVYVWLNAFADHLKLSQNYLLISYTSKENEKFTIKKKRIKCWIMSIFKGLRGYGTQSPAGLMEDWYTSLREETDSS